MQVTSAREKVVLFGFEDGAIPEYTVPNGKFQTVELATKDGRSSLYILNGLWEAYSLINFKIPAEKLALIEEGDQFTITFYIDKFECAADNFNYRSRVNDIDGIAYESGNVDAVPVSQWITVTLSAEDTASLKTNGTYGIWLEQPVKSDYYNYKLYIDEFAILKAL